MPEVYLTESQKADARYRKLRHSIGDRVADTKRKKKLKLMELANGLNMGHTTVAKIMDGEDVTITTTKFLQILDMAGLMLVDRKVDEIAANGRKQGFC